MLVTNDSLQHALLSYRSRTSRIQIAINSFRDYQPGKYCPRPTIAAGVVCCSTRCRLLARAFLKSVSFGTGSHLSTAGRAPLTRCCHCIVAALPVFDRRKATNHSCRRWPIYGFTTNVYFRLENSSHSCGSVESGFGRPLLLLQFYNPLSICAGFFSEIEIMIPLNSWG